MGSEEVHAQNLKFESLERPDWMLTAGLSKGIYHDRRSLGIVLYAGSKIRFRLKVPALNSGVTLRLLNDDQKTEQSAEVITQWSELTATVPSVPFVDTPYTDKADELFEIETDVDSSTELTIYVPGMADSEFFYHWNTQGGAFALLYTEYAQILVPVKDRVTLSALGGLWKLSNYYDQVFEYFNKLAGLSFDTQVPTDRNIPNRYFMKADKSGGGAAYYGREWTAETNDSVSTFWLDTSPTNWGSLHEIGHGYEGGFMISSTVPLAEVWNNVFAASYQYKFMGDDVYRHGWLYAGVNGEADLYARAMRAFDGDQTVNGAMALFFLMLIFMRTGDQGITEFNQRYRRLSNTAGFQTADYPAMGFLSEVAIDVADSDTTHFMAHVDAFLTRRQRAVNAYSAATPVYPLYAAVAPANPEPLRLLLGIRSPLHLVSSAQLKRSGLTRSVVFSFDTNVFNKINGKAFVLKSGSGKSIVVKVDASSKLVLDLPVGVYALQLPVVPDGSLEADEYYVVVNQALSQFRCNYVQKHASWFADQVIYLGGLYGNFCLLTVDVSLGRLLFDVVHDSPHVYFPDEVYASVIIRNAQGGVVFEHAMLGDKTALIHRELPIAKDFTIEIMHRESVRIRVSSSSRSPVIDGAKQINRLKVTERGLANSELGTDTAANLKAEVERVGEIFERLPHLCMGDDFPMKGNLKRAINTFDEPVRSELFERYRKVEFVPPSKSQTVEGQLIRWSFFGNGGRILANVTIDMRASALLMVSISEAVPHEYFSSVYFSILVSTSNGRVIYLRQMRGDVLAEAESISIPISIGDIISVMHREASRNFIEADVNGRLIYTGLLQHATYKGTRTLDLASYWPAGTNLESVPRESNTVGPDFNPKSEE